MPVSVRQATVDDAAAVAAVNLASWEATYRGVVADLWLDAQTLQRRTETWAAMLRDGRTLLVAEGGDGDGEVVGYCGMSLPARDEDCGDEVAEVAAIYVAPTALRSGAGSLLMGRALELAAQDGYRETILWVLTRNAPARAFYTRHGFAADGAVKWSEPLQAEEMRLRRAL